VKQKQKAQRRRRCAFCAIYYTAAPLES